MSAAIEFTATFGVMPGYDPQFMNYRDVNDGPALDAWMTAMESERQKSGIVVGAVVSSQRVLYPQEFGCPARGEPVVVFTGVSNPQFVNNQNEFITAVERIVRSVKHQLKQERVTLTFNKVFRHVYLDGDKTRAWESGSY